MLNPKKVMLIEVQDWDKLVKETYNKIYSFQQQNGCRERGTFKLIVPSKENLDQDMPSEIPYEINGNIMGIKFDIWLKTPKKKYETIFWNRNFYPDIYTLADDLHKKGLLKAGTYLINIDW